MLESLFRQYSSNILRAVLSTEGLLDYYHKGLKFFLKVIIMDINYQDD